MAALAGAAVMSAPGPSVTWYLMITDGEWTPIAKPR